jgi:hypothetical protein
MLIRTRLVFLALFTTLCGAAFAQKQDQPTPRTDEDILRSVKLPDGYAATVFAKPPQLGYPTSVSAAVDGTIFVAVDENGSIDRSPNRGRVVRMRDTDGDGKADEFKGLRGDGFASRSDLGRSERYGTGDALCHASAESHRLHRYRR